MKVPQHGIDEEGIGFDYSWPPDQVRVGVDVYGSGSALDSRVVNDHGILADGQLGSRGRTVVPEDGIRDHGIGLVRVKPAADAGRVSGQGIVGDEGHGLLDGHRCFPRRSPDPPAPHLPEPTGENCHHHPPGHESEVVIYSPQLEVQITAEPLSGLLKKNTALFSYPVTIYFKKRLVC